VVVAGAGRVRKGDEEEKRVGREVEEDMGGLFDISVDIGRGIGTVGTCRKVL